MVRAKPTTTRTEDIDTSTPN